MLKLFSWNVNGLRAVYNKGFADWVSRVQPDILGLQEIKATPDQLPAELNPIPGYHAYFAPAVKKGYSGVALYSKREPKRVQIGLGIEEYDVEGRTIIAEYDSFVFITAYFPNGKADLSRVDYKLAYSDAFLAYCNAQRAQGKAVIFCGDVNTAHKEIDLARPKENRKVTGFLPIECAWMDKLVGAGYIDIFRERNPALEGAYCWWSNRSGARERNIGWRIDYFFITPDLREKVVDAQLHPEVLGADHCPISLELAVDS